MLADLPFHECRQIKYITFKTKLFIMGEFLKVALKPQWKTILVIFALLIIQTIFQMEIIDLFSQALTGVKNQQTDLLF
jgi:hypothetical protein